MDRLSARRLQQRLVAFLVAGLGGILATGISLGMALYDAAHPPEVPQRTAGETIDTGRWRIVLHNATTGAVPPTGIKPSTPKQLVMVSFDARNLSAEPSNVLGPVFALEPETKGVPRPIFYLARDKYFAGSLNPDMPERVIGVWEWPDGVTVPDRLTITLKGQIYKRRDNLYGASGWFDSEPVARVTLPVAKEGS